MKRRLSARCAALALALLALCLTACGGDATPVPTATPYVVPDTTATAATSVTAPAAPPPPTRDTRLQAVPDSTQSPATNGDGDTSAPALPTPTVLPLQQLPPDVLARPTTGQSGSGAAATATRRSVSATATALRGGSGAPVQQPGSGSAAATSPTRASGSTSGGSGSAPNTTPANGGGTNTSATQTALARSPSCTFGSLVVAPKGSSVTSGSFAGDVAIVVGFVNKSSAPCKLSGAPAGLAMIDLDFFTFRTNRPDPTIRLSSATDPASVLLPNGKNSGYFVIDWRSWCGDTIKDGLKISFALPGVATVSSAVPVRTSTNANFFGTPKCNQTTGSSVYYGNLYVLSS